MRIAGKKLKQMMLRQSPLLLSLRKTSNSIYEHYFVRLKHDQLLFLIILNFPRP